MEKHEKFVWKKSYSLVLLANAAYIILFYIIMTLFS
ncbi:hypothetical protein SAMN05444483_101687 [Salegentibacter echinorum]|uniref:Uncharacterized protein n=1 Tax=Salegentibacter echinorum TaxID=1073325 RepID=A0A1M5CVH4_SALEC|nr:hypothetical protein SAMN05444483_101687 [Salegentibacter echinorum]